MCTSYCLLQLAALTVYFAHVHACAGEWNSVRETTTDLKVVLVLPVDRVSPAAPIGPYSGVFVDVLCAQQFFWIMRPKHFLHLSNM